MTTPQGNADRRNTAYQRWDVLTFDMLECREWEGGNCNTGSPTTGDSHLRDRRRNTIAGSMASIFPFLNIGVVGVGR
jgi:hypothetical protein